MQHRGSLGHGLNRGLNEAQLHGWRPRGALWAGQGKVGQDGDGRLGTHHHRCHATVQRGSRLGARMPALARSPPRQRASAGQFGKRLADFLRVTDTFYRISR
jgi:hypothetical protein